MKVFYNRDFKGHYPVGVSAVVIAPDHIEAARLLRNELSSCGLDQRVDPSEMFELDTSVPFAIVLQDGDY